MRSPSSTMAMGPPSMASGETCPMAAPRVPPENLPSVIKATSASSPIPAMTDVGTNISRIPGPPLGPSYRIITTSPFFIFPAMMSEVASSSLSNTRAVPSWRSIRRATADCFTTHPEAARFPNSTASPPCLWYGLSRGRMTLLSLIRLSSMFSLTGLPVTVRQSVRINPLRESSFITALTPPARSRSST